MFLIECPNCGERDQSEFSWGGELRSRPESGEHLPPEEWAEYLYMRDNQLGVVREWWRHRAGCGEWFVAERNSKTHELLRTYFRE